MKVLNLMVSAIFLFIFLGTGLSYAGEIDILLQKLVEKGVLTPGEAQQIKTETQEQVKKEIAQGKYSGLPQWVQNTKFKGDFRLRYQYDYAKKLPANNQVPRDGQHRARIRLRAGLESKVNEKLKFAFGLATGSTTDPRSTNQTLGQSSTKKSIVLDYAYAQYSPVKWATLFGGKFKIPFWEPGDLIWDTDITPEGGAVALSHKLNSNTEIFAHTGVFIIGEAANDESDPTMYSVQTGVTHNVKEWISLKGAISYYGFTGVTNKSLTNSAGTNTLNSAGTGLRYNYKNITPALEIGIKEPLKALGLNIAYFALFGEYVNNIESQVKCRNTGYMFGFKLGAEKIEKWADWQFRYNYAMLGKDAILDILPDSDRYGGATGIRAHEGMFDFGLGKNTWLGVDYYYGERLPGSFASATDAGTQSRPRHVLQIDWNMKF